MLDQFRFDFLPCCGGNVRVYVWDVTAAFQESSPNVRAVYPWGKAKQTCVSSTEVETTKSRQPQNMRDKTPHEWRECELHSLR